MNPLNQVNINEIQSEYNISLAYHSELKNKDFQGKITGIEHQDGRISFRHGEGYEEKQFEFTKSDPDRVIAVAQMMIAFAQMVKIESKKAIDAESCSW